MTSYIRGIDASYRESKLVGIVNGRRRHGHTGLDVKWKVVHLKNVYQERANLQIAGRPKHVRHVIYELTIGCHHNLARILFEQKLLLHSKRGLYCPEV